jgi:hypothetical protein
VFERSNTAGQSFRFENQKRKMFRFGQDIRNTPRQTISVVDKEAATAALAE